MSQPITIRIGPDSNPTGLPSFKGSKARFALAEKNGSLQTVFQMIPNKTYFLNKKLNNPNDGKLFSHVPGGKYKGEWLHNKKEGFGTQTYSKGHVYEGEWQDGKRDGKGTYYFLFNGKLKKMYAGDWISDRKEGMGVYIDPTKGDRYEGSWINNLKDGRGKMVYHTGEVYEGEWREGVRCGSGVLTLRNGDRYEGHFAKDLKEGPGRFYYFSTRKVYEGEWVDGTPKCGEFAALTEGAFDQGGFNLPGLTLSDASGVLSSAEADIRQERAANGGGGEGVGIQRFSEQDMNQIRLAFNAFSNNQDGTVAIGDLGELIQSLGIEVGEGALEELLEELGAEEGDDINYAEFVDIVVVVSGGV
jgi:hypothetical protein